MEGEIHFNVQAVAVRSLRFGQRLGLLAHRSLLRFHAQLRLQHPANPLGALVIRDIAFNVAQVQKAQAEAPIALTRRQTKQQISNLAVL